MATKPEVYKALLTVTPLFAHYKMPTSDDERAALTNSWHMMVGHLDIETLAAAFRVAAGKSEFFPTPALVLECAVSLTTTPQRTGDDAWGDVQRAIKAHGFYHPPGNVAVLAVGSYEWHFDDPLVERVVAGLGWRYLCHSEDEMADRAHFRKDYETLQARALADARLTPDLLAFRDEKQAQIAAPNTDRRQAAAQLMAGLADKKGIR